MRAWTLQQIDVWLGRTSECKSFSHGFEWASRLSLPMRITAAESALVHAELTASVEAASRNGVAIEIRIAPSESAVALDPFPRPNSLCVYSDLPATPSEPTLMDRSNRRATLCRLRCANAFSPIQRLLVVCRDVDTHDKGYFLANAAKLCETLEVDPVILILTDSDDAVHPSQHAAEEAFLARRIPVDVDFAMHDKPLHAVSRAASWRRCSTIVIPRSAEAVDESLRKLSATASVLALPDAIPLEMPARFRGIHGSFAFARNESPSISNTAKRR